MADNNRIHNIESDIQNDVNNIGKRGIAGKQVSEPARSRTPIGNAITKIAADSADTLDYFRERIDNNLATIADYSSVFNYASDVLSEELKDRNRLIAVRDSAIKTARKLKEPKTEYTKDGETPTFSWTETAGEWVLKTPRWPRFNRFIVNRLNAVTGNYSGNFEDSVKYSASGDRTGITDINIMDWFSGVQLTAGLVPALTNAYPVDSNGVFIDPSTGGPKDTMGTGCWDYNLNGRAKLHISVPQGLAGDDSVQMRLRPFFTDKVWTNGNIADGMPTNFQVGIGQSDTLVNGHVVEVGNEVPGRPMTGAIIVFQKCAFRENSSKAKSASNQTALAKVFIDGTDTVLLSDNWDWYQQTAIYLPRGAHATACYIDADGNKFFQDVAWGARPTFDSSYWFLSYPHGSVYQPAPEDYEPGKFIFSGGRYMSADGKKKYGLAFNSARGSSISDYQYFWPRKTSPSNVLGIYNIADGHYHIGRYATSGSSWGGSIYNPSTKDDVAGRYFMVPVKIIGVYDKLTHEQEDALRR